MVFFILTTSSAFCKNNPKNFTELSRYIETLEINDEVKNKQIQKENEFEEQAIIDVAKRYEENAIELKLGDINDSALNDINNDRLFQLKVNETQFKIENGIKNENIIWDSSKSFVQAYFNSSRHLAPIPAVINSSKISTNVSPAISAQLGQVYLNDANGSSLLFIRANESTYNTGSVISYKGSHFNLSTGSFSSSYNHASSGGAILSSKSIFLPNNTGSFILGGGIFSKEEQSSDTTTGGGFIEYTYKRFKLNAQIGQSKYSNSNDLYTSLYLIPEFKLSDSLYLTTRFIRNVSNETMQDELALTYKPKNSKNNLEFEINTSSYYTNSSNINRRIKLSTSFKI